MKNEYFNKITKLLSRARSGLARTHRLESKNCFGAVAGYIDSHIFISCGKFGVALRLPPETLDNVFKEKGVKHLKYFPNGHVKKEYAVLPERIMKSKQRFKRLIDRSIKYALLPRDHIVEK